LPHVVRFQIYSPSFPLTALLLTPHAEVRAWGVTNPMRKSGQQQQSWQFYFPKAAYCTPRLGSTQASEARLS